MLFVCQAERELKPWIAKDDDLGQKMWRVNQRIVKVIVELMRNHEAAESLVILASASDVLLRATDGMLVDGEACTLPQLEVDILLNCLVNFPLYTVSFCSIKRHCIFLSNACICITHLLVTRISYSF